MTNREIKIRRLRKSFIGLNRQERQAYDPFFAIFALLAGGSTPDSELIRGSIEQMIWRVK
jgi:hypothetical protein